MSAIARVKNKVDKIHAEAVKEWNREWTAWGERFFKPLSRNEIDVVIEYFGLPVDDSERKAASEMAGAWEAELGFEDNGDERWSEFIGSFMDACPESVELPDLTNWPEFLPEAPGDFPPPRETVEAVLKFTRSHMALGRTERLAAGLMFYSLLVMEYARVR